MICSSELRNVRADGLFEELVWVMLVYLEEQQLTAAFLPLPREGDFSLPVAPLHV
jgi:hypothetical protein